MELWHDIVEKLARAPSIRDGAVPAQWLWVALAAGLAMVVLPGVWRLVRVAVTVVHELGHGFIGVIVGRSFTGLVLRPDMSGHAVTAGPSRGPGRILTTWAGYPAPAIVATLLIVLASSGWAGASLVVLLVCMVAGLVRARSFYTVVVLLVLGGGLGWLWWYGEATLQALVLVGGGTMLLMGSWRHLGAVATRPGPGSDPHVLATLTRVPRALWLLSFVLVMAAASWWAVIELRRLVA